MVWFDPAHFVVSRHGNVTEVLLMYDRETQKPRGFGFVTFDNEEIVKELIAVRP